ncbi:hypothetical protein AGMMS49942_00810 [Spirochaetia bacterium]|nr:hypothetical protein AGMMS49942_00810 [Spirochaetia bacterium]
MATQTAMEQPQMGLTFEKVWATLDRISLENAERQKKLDEHFAQTTADIEEMGMRVDQTAAYIEEIGMRVDQTTANVDKMAERVDKVSKNVGGLNRSMGELIETLIAARLWEKFDAYPYKFRRAYQRIPLFDETDRILTDIDILLSNGEYGMPVEVKASLHRIDDVDRHLKRMELILKYPPDECKGKTLIGAMAGGAVDPDVQAYAHSVGFFVLELTGESVHLVKPPAGFIPRQW